MVKTVTATFESVDAATFAARRVTSHFDEIHGVKIQYHKLDRPDDDRLEALAWAGPAAAATSPAGSGMPMGSAGTIAPLGAVTLAEDWDERDDPSPPRERAKVRITADARIAGKVEASLLGSGGWDVRD